MNNIILVAGATGNLGGRITRELLKNGAEVRVLVRQESDPQKITELEALGAKVMRLDAWRPELLTRACGGATCIISALAGLREVVVDAQKVLLDAAVAVGVKRFIPSDYSLDFTKCRAGENRNLDWRREFHTYLDAAPITATSIFNGAFMELLTGDMPLILFKPKFVIHWGSADHKMAFTTMDDTAAFTARAAMDDNTPRYLHIAGDLVSPREIRSTLNNITHDKFRLIRTGGQGLLGFIIKIARKMAPGEKELYPAWQGMQYMHNMIDIRSTISKLDNDRYPGLCWTPVEALLAKHIADG